MLQEHCLRCAMCLLWGADLRLQPSWQMSIVQDPRKTWLVIGSLLTVWWKLPVSGTEIAPCLPAVVVALLPLCFWLGVGREGPVRSLLALLWCLLNPLLCELARLCIKLEKFLWESSLSLSLFFFFFPLSLAIPVWVAISH